MAKKAWVWSRFWQTWTLFGVLGTALAGARLLPARGNVLTHSASGVASLPKRVTPQQGVETSPQSVPSVDPLFARLAVAATSLERCALLDQLQPSDDPQATYAIAAVLEQAHLGSVRSCATQALSRQPTSEAQSFLIDLAEDPVREVHRSALEALASRDEAARAVVVEATHSEDLELRISAVMALLKGKRAEAYGAAVLLLPQIDDAETLSSLIDALGESHDPRALPALEALVDNAERESHLHAISALGELGVRSAASRLEGLLELGSSAEFSAAVEALQKLRPESIAPKLRALLGSGNGERRELALSAILSLDVPDLPSIMRAQLRSGDPALVLLVLRRLSSAPDPSFEAELIAIADGSDWRWRRTAASALAALATPGARAALQRLASSLPDSLSRRLSEGLLDDSETLRAQRIATLTRAEPASRGTLLELARDPSASAQSALIAYLEGHEVKADVLAAVVELAPRSTVQRLAERRANAPSSEKLGLIQGLARRGDPNFKDLLRADLRADPPTRNAALSALVQLGDDAVSAELERLARNGDAADRGLAVQLFGARSDTQALQSLERLGSDPDPRVMGAALQALQTRSPELVVRLAARALRESTPEARVQLLSSLDDLKTSLSRPLFELALADADDAVSVRAIQSLATLQGPASAQRLLALVNDSGRSEQVRAEAASGLRALGGPLARANRALLDSLSEPEAETSEAFVCNPSI
jgi:HEAT repeat protein